MARSLNRVQLIGNLTRDPELRYTPQGTAVATFSIATNRRWATESGEKKEDVEFHRVVAWNKLAELCSQLLAKGRKVYVEGRLSTRSWTAQDGSQKSTTEIIISDMIILDSKKEGMAVEGENDNLQVDKKTEGQGLTERTQISPAEEMKEKSHADDVVNPDDIPF